MAKVKTEVCEICRKEDCDGKKYQTEYMYGDYGFHIGVKIVCSNDPELKMIDGKLKYRLVCGHGSVNFYEIKEI